MPWAVNEPQTVEQKVELTRRFQSGLFDRGEDYVYGISIATKRALGRTVYTRLKDNALEIGYWLHKDFINRGFITRSSALTKVVELYHVDRMEIHCSVEDLASASVPRKLRYVHEATRRRLSCNGRSTNYLMIWISQMNIQIRPAPSAVIRAFDVVGNSLL